MALVYFDSSALVKLLLDEPGTPLVAELWDACDGALSSRLAYPEVRAALAAAGRNHELDADEAREAERVWEEYWAATRKVELTPDVEQQAGQLARSHALRGADAVHLASALAVDDGELVVAVWDHRLHSGALAAGVQVAPANLGAKGKSLLAAQNLRERWPAHARGRVAPRSGPRRKISPEKEEPWRHPYRHLGYTLFA